MGPEKNGKAEVDVKVPRPVGPFDLAVALAVFFFLSWLAWRGGEYIGNFGQQKAQEQANKTLPEDITHECESCKKCCERCNVKDMCCCRHLDHCPCIKDPTNGWDGPIK